MSMIYEPAGRAREYAPLALNLYRGCSHGCTYCYAPSACHVDREAFHAEPRPRVDILAKLERELLRGSAATEGDPVETLSTPPAVLLCFTSDPYQPLAALTGITRRAIELLHEHGYPVHVLTKAGTAATADFDLLGSNFLDAFATTLTFIDPADSAEWEPAAATPADRIEAIQLAHASDIETWVSLEPVIDPEQTLELIRRTHKDVDLFNVGTLNHHKAAKETDWLAFAQAAVALLKELRCAFYLKADLAKHLGYPDGVYNLELDA